MPDVSGFDLCRTVRAIPRWQDLPVVFLTGGHEVKDRVEAFNAGGDDYLTKPVIREELLARVRVRVERQRLLQERRDRDPLTGLLLRRAFLDAVSTRFGEAQRRDTSITLCLLDVDHFKRVNDTHGHLAGDRVLTALGKLLAGRFRSGDLRGRWGGEEFVLAFPGEGADTMVEVLRRVLSEFAALRFATEGAESFGVTFSAGLASHPSDGAHLEAVLRAADRRLYLAKNEGRGRVVGPDSVPTEPHASQPENAVKAG